jgi:hypothetical protein
MALLDTLTTARDQIAARMDEMTRNPKPNYSLDGESYSWESYFNMLSTQLLAVEQSMQRASGPGPAFMNKSRGRS